MKKLFAILLAAFALSTFAAEPAAPTKEQPMLLAKKKDHSKDKKATPSKSDKKAPAKKADTKSK